MERCKHVPGAAFQGGTTDGSASTENASPGRTDAKSSPKALDEKSGGKATDLSQRVEDNAFRLACHLARP
jgi:hypothetical protein